MSIALAFMAVLALVNLRGVSESVKFNVVLTLVELTGLLLVILIGFYAMSQGGADFSRVMVFETSADRSTFVAITAATSLAFFAMVGFEDSVNMAEETHDPTAPPQVMLTGLGIAAFIYVLVSIAAVALVPVGRSPTARRRCSRWSEPAPRACRWTRSTRSSRCSPSPTPR